MLDNNLVKMALWQLNRTKQAFIPVGAGSDPNAGGGAPPGGPPPGGPPAGGASPGGPPPVPAAGGGAPPSAPPPPDPSAGAGIPPPDPSQMIQQAVTQGVSQAMAAQGGGAGGAGGAGKPPKPDISTVAMDLFQLKKMFHHFLRIQQIELPHDLLDGPGRDPQTGQQIAVAGGGSDPSMQAPNQPAPAGPPSSIAGIQPIQGAFPGAGPPQHHQHKAASIGTGTGTVTTGKAFMSKAASVAMLCRKRREFVALNRGS